MFEFTTITMSTPPPPPPPSAPPHHEHNHNRQNGLHFHDATSGKGEPFHVSEVRWMNAGVCEIADEHGNPKFVEHKGEVWTKRTYSEGDPWQRVPMLKRRNNKPVATWENAQQLRAQGPKLTKEVYTSLLDAEDVIRKQQLFYLGQLLDGGSGRLSRAWPPPDREKLKAALATKNAEKKRRRKLKGGEAVVEAALLHEPNTTPQIVDLQEGADENGDGAE